MDGRDQGNMIGYKIWQDLPFVVSNFWFAKSEIKNKKTNIEWKKDVVFLVSEIRKRVIPLLEKDIFLISKMWKVENRKLGQR